MKIRKDDKVLVISGKDKNKEWTVLKVLTKTNRIIVEWLNMVTRNYKKQWINPWQSIKKESAMDVSNVMLVCPFTKKPTRVWFVLIEEKNKEWKSIIKKFRFSKKALKENWGESKDYIIK